MASFRSIVFAVLLGAWIAPADAEVAVRDDRGATVTLAAPARRIVSLAPHITENLYAAGAGERIVGVVDYSDFPEAAKRIPRVGGYSQPDLESIVALRPDLVVVWQSSNADSVVNKLEALRLTVYQNQPEHLEDIPADIEKLGRLAGTEAVARRAAAAFRQRLTNLRTRYADAAPVTVFYQVWNRPLLTVGGGQIINDVIQLCGGDNVFVRLAGKAPAVSVEAVLAADPEAIVASGMGIDTPIGLDDWRRWTRMKAVRRGNLFHVAADLMQRPTPRLLDGAEQFCRDLETARGRRR
jgi:iron complex transport system substrate-binding protein